MARSPSLRRSRPASGPEGSSARGELADAANATGNRPGAPRWALPLVAALCLCALACEEEPAVAGPEEAVKSFIGAMQGVHGDPKRGEAAVALLWEPARDNLNERARRASAASGHPVKPGEMLAPSWFSLQFQPRSWSSRIDGTWAEVTVRGEDPSQGQFRVRCVREDDAWRVALELPPLSPIRKRFPELESKP